MIVILQKNTTVLAFFTLAFYKFIAHDVNLALSQTDKRNYLKFIKIFI